MQCISVVFHAPRIEKWSLSVVAECGRGLTFPAWLFCNPRHWQAAAPSTFRELLLVTRSKTPPGHTPSGKAFDRCFQISMAYLCRPGRHSVCRMFWVGHPLDTKEQTSLPPSFALAPPLKQLTFLKASEHCHSRFFSQTGKSSK